MACHTVTEMIEDVTHTIGSLAWREPLGWVLLALCQAVAAWWFLLLVERHRERLESQVSGAGSPLGVTDLVLVPYFGGAPLLALVVLLTAALSLRMVVQDRRQGTLSLLLAAPPSALALVLGKYLGSLACAAPASPCGA